MQDGKNIDLNLSATNCIHVLRCCFQMLEVTAETNGQIRTQSVKFSFIQSDGKITLKKYGCRGMQPIEK